jgi:hypothetical protein
MLQTDFVRRRGRAAASGPAHPPLKAGAGSSNGSDSAAAAEPAAAPPPAYEWEEQRQLLEGMDLVMRTYESEMQKPLRNIVGGELVRTLLIQVGGQ